MARIAIIGTGRMGSALARAFVQAGHEVTVWNRTASKSRALKKEGIAVAESIVDAVLERELVVSILTDYQATRAVFSEPSVLSALQRTTFLELASGTPNHAREGAAWAAKHNIPYLVGAIMVTPDLVGRPEATFLYAGPRALFEKYRSVLAAVAGSGMYVGDSVGHASALDNAILVVFWGAIHGALQGAAICRAEGFPVTEFRRALVGAWPVFQPSLVDVLTRIDEGRFAADEAAAATIAICHASMRHILELSRDLGLETSLPRASEDVFARAIAAGLGEQDTAAALEVIFSEGKRTPRSSR